MQSDAWYLLQLHPRNKFCSKKLKKCSDAQMLVAAKLEKKRDKRLAKSKDDHRVDGNAPHLTLPFRS